MNNNPLLEKFENTHEAIPFTKIKKEHFMPALVKTKEIANSRIKKIIENNDMPNFSNTIEALEISSIELERVYGIFSNLYIMESNNDFKELAGEISPFIAEFQGEIFTNSELFKKVQYVNDSSNNLNSEEFRLLDKTFLSFTRNGALLTDSQKMKLKQIDLELSTLGPNFSKNVLDATNDFFMYIDHEKDVIGIPKNTLEVANKLAINKGYSHGWVFTLQMPSYLPVMQYAKNRELRKKLNLAYGTKNINGDFCNKQIILKIIELRNQRAKLLGYNNHSAYVLDQRMAKSPNLVFEFLDDLYQIVYPVAKNELDELMKLAQDLDGISDFMPWDTAYYSEKLKKEKFDFDQELLRPYFKAEFVISGIFEVARKMYGINFNPIYTIPLYHEEVKTYEVIDSYGKNLGLLYMDLHPRETKNSGAWMDTLRIQGWNGELVETPQIVICGNLTPSTNENPSLLSFDEVRTIFHEFGHALHGLFSNVKYKSLASPNVYWDFVELPSQIMENWLLEPETLELFAKHYQTGEILPRTLINKIKETQAFNAATMCNRQLSLCYLDMAWHVTNPENIKDVIEFENKVMEKTRLLPLVESNISTGFSHIFAGGYSSGYYSYKWAEVLDADAFELFKEKGIFDKKTSDAFRKLLSLGNTLDPMKLYKEFRGKEPDPKALLRRDGLIK